MKHLFLASICSFLALNTLAEVNIRDRIDTQHFFLERYGALFGQLETTHIPTFLEAVQSVESDSVQSRIEDWIETLDPILNQRIIMPLVYWKWIEPNPLKVREVLEYQIFYRIQIVRDLIDDPIGVSESDKRAGLELLEKLVGVKSTANVFKKSIDPVQKLAAELARQSDPKEFKRRFLDSELSGFVTVFEDQRDYSLSALGFVPGNKVDVVSENDQSTDRMKWVNDRVIFNGGKFDLSKDYMKMPALEQYPEDLLVPDLVHPEGHVAFSQDPIFMKIRDMIYHAEDSIFINIFLFGGTLGGAIAHYMIEKTIQKRKKNPNFKTLLLHDYATNYNMKPEMMPIFRYIRDRIDADPDLGVYLVQANIQRHTPGVPFGITNLVPKNEDTMSGIQQQNTYFESKIDHSKVIVTDVNSDSPKAYFGSKNWTDHSGAYYYDDAIYVEGPAAALVQDSYYDDLDAALTLDEKERQLFFFKEEGLDNERHLKNRDEILEWFRVKRDSYPEVGSEKVRISEANVDGRIKNTRNMLVDMIMRAETNIYMEQLFIYDRYVVDALIKRKIQKPNLDIKILADHNGNFALNGLPNTIFLKEMIDAGIEVRARNTVPVETTFPDGTKKTYHQENHRKITSVDGKVILGGSSNINADTLQGSFREFGAQIFDEQVIAAFDGRFLEDWKDKCFETCKVDDIHINDFQVSLLGMELSKEKSGLLNRLAAFLLRAKDTLEKRD